MVKKTDENRPGGEFRIDRFYKEFALGTGLVLRFDADFSVLRLAIGWPLYKPSLDEGSRWVIDEIDIFNSSWRKNNLVFNIAIGYPF